MFTKFLTLILLLPFMAQALDYSDEGLEEQSFEHPIKQFSIIATEEGYYPQSFSVFQGDKVQFFVTGLKEKSSCLILDEKEIYLAAHKGKISEGSALFDKAGRFMFHCPTDKIKGFITVLPKKKAQMRLPSSETSTVKIWRPGNNPKAP